MAKLARRWLLPIILFALVSLASFAQIIVRFAPPPLPIYEQPIVPGEGYVWAPGYWAWGDGGYFWVPGTWVLAPQPGYFWTPGYWGWDNGGFLFHQGYWGPRVGYYGGINYGYGYFGNGFDGGRWEGDRFFYNRAVANVNETVVRNVYNTTVVNNTTVNHVSYNGGEGGVTARPTPEEEVAEREHHVAPVPAQLQQVEAARANPQMRASANQGKPPVAATAKAGDLQQGAVRASEAGGPYRAPSNPGSAATENNAQPHSTAKHASDLAPHQPSPMPGSSNAKADQKRQQQEQKMADKQNQQHQKTQQQQERDHQRMAQQNADATKKQQMEDRHAQQTQQMEQRHMQQQEHMQEQQHMQSQPKEPKPAGPGGGSR